MKVIVAVTGASGTIYAHQCLERLLQCDDIEQIALIVSRCGEEVARHECIDLPCDQRIVRYAVDDMFAPTASGSARYEKMIIIPASMGTIGRIASGVSLSLIERSADVMLKERRQLICVVRETPYSLIHLRNMTTLTEAGAIILPASPLFYSHPKDIEALTTTVTERVLALAGIDLPHYEWGE